MGTVVEDKGPQRVSMETTFPKYRMLMDGRHFYRIDRPDSFTEIQIVGSRRTLHRITASAYPEKVRIQQMLNMEDGLYEEIDAARWEEEWDALHG